MTCNSPYMQKSRNSKSVYLTQIRIPSAL